ncbi:MAG: Fe-S cluster assembly protein SufD [Bacteroidales bacterium]|nr:Fe-S cluster assembly protein SufD [Bacteroidales bacterium]
MQINDYITNLPTHHDEDYLYTDAREAMSAVDTVVNASIDATGIGGSIIGSVHEMGESDAFESSIAQDLINLNTVGVDDVLSVEFNDINPQPVTINLSSNGGKSTLAQSRINITATKDSQGQLIIRTNELKSAANCVIKVDAEEGSTLDIIYIQTESVDAPVFINTKIDEANDAHVSVSTININPGFVRNNLQIDLNGEHSELKAYGIYKSEAGHIDNTTLIRHLVPNCTTEELYKGILGGNAKGAFAGRIVVAPDAQKTSAQQTNRNMLLSDDAHAYAKPQLEIYADDVKCSHGATSGQLDQTQLFYMQQRGINAETAKKLLTAAFALEVVNKIPSESVRDEINALLTNID